MQYKVFLSSDAELCSDRMVGENGMASVSVIWGATVTSENVQFVLR